MKNSLGFLFKGFVSCCAVLALLVGMTPQATAQTAGAGTITGTVTDSSKSVVHNASVTVLNTDTGISRRLQTNSAGIYNAPFLQPGHYEVTVSGSGFGTVAQKNLTLQVGQTLTIDAVLPVASASSTVLVSSAAPLLDPERTDVSQVVNERMISNLPVNGRRWDNFVLLTPNVAPDGNTGLISYRGISGLYNSNQVDGTNNNQAFFSEARGRSIGAPYVYSQDSIKEFQSAASSYSAEFGQAAGGQINAITKSGTNNMHGDLFYLLRYPSLNALDPLSKFQGIQNNNPLLLTQPVHQQQQFGGSIGGPFIKDKLFYFLTYDGFRKVNPIFYTSTTSAAALTHFGNNTYVNPTNSQPVNTCYAPLTTAQCTAAADYLISLINSYPRNIKQDIFFPKIDYQINQSNHLSTSFLWQNFAEPNGYNTSTSVTNGSITQNGPAYFHERFFVASLDSVLSSNTANQFRFQWSRDLETAGTNSPGPAVNISGVSAYGETLALPRAAFPDEHRIEFADTLTTTRGRHTLKAGVDLNFIHEVLINLFQGNGNYYYFQGSNATNFANWVQDVYQVNGGQHYNSFAQVHDPITGVGKDDFWNKNLAGFVEDSWKARSNVTINAGLRYDVQLVPQPPKPNTTSPLAQYYTSTINISYHMLQPRLGIAWQATPTTVVRAGYGIFYGLNSNSTYYTMRVENGVYQQQYNVSLGVFKTDANGQPVAGTYPSYAPVAPNVFFTPPGPPLAAPFSGATTSQAINTNPPLSSLAFRGMDPHFLNPYSHAMDIAVEQQLPGRMTLSIGYVGNRGMRLPVFIDANVDPTSAVPTTYDIVNSTGATVKQVTLPFYTKRVTTANQSVLTGFSSVNSWYNSMAATLKKPFAHGLELLLNYTWAHAMDGGQVSGVNGTFNGTDTPLDPFNRKAEYARSDLDMRGRFVGSIVYSPTLGFISNKLLHYAANGWTFSGTATEQTGFPLTQTMSNSPKSLVGDGGLTGAEVSLYNSGTGGRVPNAIARRNAFPGPGVHNIDFRISRSFPIHNNIRLELMGEAFNLANHRNILSVSTTGYQYYTPNAAKSPCLNHSNGCLAPYTSVPFATPTSTSSILYGPRQLQLTGKFYF
jgi:hypothetical protein